MSERPQILVVGPRGCEVAMAALALHGMIGIDVAIVEAPVLAEVHLDPTDFKFPDLAAKEPLPDTSVHPFWKGLPRYREARRFT